MYTLTKHKLYRFSSNTDVLNNISKVNILCRHDYDYKAKCGIYHIAAIAKNENDLVLFMLANPHFKLGEKDEIWYEEK